MLRKSRVVGSQMALRSCQRRRSSFRNRTTRVTSVPAKAPAISAPTRSRRQDHDQRDQDQQEEEQSEPFDRGQGLTRRRLDQGAVRGHVDARVHEAPVGDLLLAGLGIEVEHRIVQRQVRRCREMVVDEPVVDLARSAAGR